MRSPQILFLTCTLLSGTVAPAIAATAGNPQRGEYLTHAGGCIACHTAKGKDAVKFAGGHELATPFGKFYGPNITPHPQAGIGKWSEADFIRAMREGKRPDGAHYFPAFPYPSYTRIVDADLRDLWAYLRSLPPSARQNQEHDLKFPFGFRFLLWGWKLLFFTPGPTAADSQTATPVGRGAYLVNALSHCGECHTPRNFLGGPKRDRFLAGGKGPDGKGVPNLTPTKLKKWGDGELKDFLTTGMTADGDVTAEAMGEVVTNTTGKLTAADLAAIIAYLRTIPALPDEKP
ncbi:MAG: c-type cytochrome [Burkholderiales bacterium]